MAKHFFYRALNALTFALASFVMNVAFTALRSIPYDPPPILVHRMRKARPVFVPVAARAQFKAFHAEVLARVDYRPYRGLTAFAA